MKIGVLGTGEVGQVMARRLAADGHDVLMGARSATNANAAAFARDTGAGAGTFAQAILHGEWILVCVDGSYTVETLNAAGRAALDGKLVIDMSNLPVPDPSESGSLGLSVQSAFPNALVVKTLNCVSAEFMTDPQHLPGNHTVFVSGNDAAAKRIVIDMLEGFGWQSIVDLGGIETARGPEHFVALWVEINKALGITDFNFALLRGSK